jgi:uncharacterized protein (DUF1501 family)
MSAMTSRQTALTRRTWLKTGMLGVAAMASAPLLFERVARAERDVGARRKVLVVVFQRGGVDGLSMVVPYAESGYRRDRPGIALAPPGKDDGALDLDGQFGLHPRLAPLEPMFRAGELALVHAVGSPHPTRSHFDAQDYLETGTPGRHSTRDGWLNRCLASAPAPGATPFRAVAFGERLPRALQGRSEALAMKNLRNFGLRGRRRFEQRLHGAFSALYAGGEDPLLRAGRQALQASRRVRELDPKSYVPANGASYPEQGRALGEVAQLIKADVGLELAFIDLGGWDTHAGQGSSAGQLGRRLDILGRSLAGFRADLGEHMRDVVVLTMSEFGRTVAQNGSGGTDHGHATAMMVLGGPVQGGKVYGRWPGLEPEQRFEGRDLAVTTDFRDLFGEIVTKHLGVTDLGRVFPDHPNDAARSLGILRG